MGSERLDCSSSLFKTTKMSKLYGFFFLFFTSKAEDLKLMGGVLYPNQDNSIFFKDNDISLGFTTRWKDEFITMIFVGAPTHFYELQLDLYVAGMWIYDVSCTSSNTCGNVNGKDLFDRKSSLTLHDLNRPFIFDQSVTGDYVSDNISFYISYRQKFGLATQVPFQSPQSGVFGLGLEYGNRDIPVREMLHHTVQSTITILADRSNNTRTEDTRPEGSLTIGRTDSVNCRNDLQFVRLYDTNAWMIQLLRVSLDEYTDRTTPLVAFRPGVEFTLAPRSFTDVFFYKIGAKPVGNGTLWGLLKGSTFTPLQLVFAFSGNVIIRLDFEDYVITPKDAQQSEFVSYITIRPNPDNSNDDFRPSWIFGNDLLRKYCLTLAFDEAAPMIGFSTNIWNPNTRQNTANLLLPNFFLCLFFVFLSK